MPYRGATFARQSSASVRQEHKATPQVKTFHFLAFS
jgi:hypothetical protein